MEAVQSTRGTPASRPLHAVAWSRVHFSQRSRLQFSEALFWLWRKKYGSGISGLRICPEQPTNTNRGGEQHTVTSTKICEVDRSD
jgi:hypothetical protein